MSLLVRVEHVVTSDVYSLGAAHMLARSGSGDGDRWRREENSGT